MLLVVVFFVVSCRHREDSSNSNIVKDDKCKVCVDTIVIDRDTIVCYASYKNRALNGDVVGYMYNKDDTLFKISINKGIPNGVFYKKYSNGIYQNRGEFYEGYLIFDIKYLENGDVQKSAIMPHVKFNLENGYLKTKILFSSYVLKNHDLVGVYRYYYVHSNDTISASEVKHVVGDKMDINYLKDSLKVRTNWDTVQLAILVYDKKLQYQMQYEYSLTIKEGGMKFLKEDQAPFVNVKNMEIRQLIPEYCGE